MAKRTCAYCGKPLIDGQLVAWSANFELVHMECFGDSFVYSEEEMDKEDGLDA